MRVPAQARPVERKYRGATARTRGGVTPALDPKDLCSLCGLLPAKYRAICEMVCGLID